MTVLYSRPLKAVLLFCLIFKIGCAAHSNSHSNAHHREHHHGNHLLEHHQPNDLLEHQHGNDLLEYHYDNDLLGVFAPHSSKSGRSGYININGIVSVNANAGKWCDPNLVECCYDPSTVPLKLPSCLWSLLGTNGNTVLGFLKNHGYTNGEDNWIESLFVSYPFW